MKTALLKVFLTASIIATMCSCQDIKLSVHQQAELDESLSRAGLHAKFHNGGIGVICLDDPVQSELSGPSFDQIVNVVRMFRDRNQITSIKSVSIQGPDSYVSVDIPGSP